MSSVKEQKEVLIEICGTALSIICVLFFSFIIDSLIEFFSHYGGSISSARAEVLHRWTNRIELCAIGASSLKFLVRNIRSLTVEIGSLLSVIINGVLNVLRRLSKKSVIQLPGQKEMDTRKLIWREFKENMLYAVPVIGWAVFLLSLPRHIRANRRPRIPSNG